ncbi:MAG: glutamate racemase [Clostridia bacterium]|nr:glutamate racemase [Clostridia bacterium]
MDSMRNLPIGIFDSGMGGLSVLREAVHLLPDESYIYFGDDRNAPYGTKDEQTIRELSLGCAEFLDRQGVKAMVVACNTATSVVVQTMRERYQVPVVSMEPAVKPPADKYSGGTIAVFATPATLRQPRYQALVTRLGLETRVRNIACDGLAGLVEEEELGSEKIRSYVRERLSVLRAEADVCALVLGCTHYTFVSDVFAQEAAGTLRGALEIFDGVGGTVRRLRQVLAERDLLAPAASGGNISLYTSGGEDTMAHMLRLLTAPFGA